MARIRQSSSAEQGQLSEAGAVPLLLALAVVVEADMQLQI